MLCRSTVLLTVKLARRTLTVLLAVTSVLFSLQFTVTVLFSVPRTVALATIHSSAESDNLSIVHVTVLEVLLYIPSEE